ncbi:acylneuraminate cytidylyltransferase [Thermincola ferriacetica]|uniref:Acylneuraminate cytidylyltransferase n=1 Tax=Thermincola ferriacetica TaxID=281456 RepID=A0A0L6W3J5_9FIRM|nr:acylneuraminate cytidylyltransferase family protein [Thermincola ferriacetica]KNZ70110.1 acylneuraminate cytidylyltransferase [Thermincola ferriacetica]
MFAGKTILALITARGGSKGLPGKNIRPLLGKPLIAWTIEQALDCPYLDRVVVSTDDREIAETARGFGAEVPFLRPPELATDEAKSIDVVLHALDYFAQQNDEYDYLVLLQPTSPLRRKEDIGRALELLIRNAARADSLVSVGEISHGHPAMVQKIDDEGLLQPFLGQRITALRRQDLSPAYVPYGVVFISKVDKLKLLKTFYQEKTLPYVIQRWQHYEIDDIYDFIVTEAILKQRLEGNHEFSG